MTWGQVTQRGSAIRRRILGRSATSALVLLLLLAAGGCGTSETEVVSLPDSQIRVIGFDGEEKSIPTGGLYDATTGEPNVQSVWVIDRQSNREVFVDVDQLPAESQIDARYILVTESPGTSE